MKAQLSSLKQRALLFVFTLVDINKVPYILDISKGSIHDAKIMESIIDTKFKNTKDIIEIVGDKGYIKNSSYIENIKNIVLITPETKVSTETDVSLIGIILKIKRN